MITDIIKALAPAVRDAAQSLFPKPEDANQRAEMESKLSLAILDHSETIAKAASDVIQAEARSESWITRSWRPLTMLTFVGLIVAYYLGLTPDTIGERQAENLLDLVKIGLGGYVVSRGAEKVTKIWKEKS